jgi:O-antigen ligase
MDGITLLILVVIGFFAVVATAIWSLRRYEVTVFLTGLSPWFSALFIPNVPDEFQREGMGSYLRIGILIFTGMIGTLQYFRLRDRGEKLPLYLVLLGIFLSVALASTSYSIDPLYTWIRSSSFLFLYGFLLGLHVWLQDRQRFEGILNTLFLLVSFFIIINAVSIVILPERVWWWDGPSRFQGLWSHPNTMGSICMIAYPVLLWKYFRSTPLRRPIVFLLFIASALMHFLTGSRASLITAFFGIFVWFFIQKKKAKLLFSLGLLCVLTLLVVEFRPSSLQREEGAKLTDLTDREKFWYGSYLLLMERPLLGYGYGVEGKIWEDPRFYDTQDTLWSGSVKASLHNGYFSIAIGLGVMGFFVWCLILFIPLWRSRSLPWNDFKSFALTVMLMCMLLNFFESLLAGVDSLAAIMFWIAWVLVGRLPNTSQKGEDSQNFYDLEKSLKS